MDRQLPISFFFFQFSATIGFLLFALSNPAYSEEFTFDISETQKKTYNVGGFLELRPVHYRLDKNSSLYKLRFYDRSKRDTLEEFNLKFQLDGSIEKGIARLVVRSNTDFQYSSIVSRHKTSLYHGYLSLKFPYNLKIDIGKKNLLWGTGYAWNPVAFIDRPKDPDDPDLNREGFAVISADYIRSFRGALKTVAFTPVIIPAYRNINDGFGRMGRMNFAGKLYLLLYGTDIDLIFLAGGSRGERFGFDFSKNITSNFELHGEFAVIKGYNKKVIDSSGTVHKTSYNAANYLVGIRYLTKGYTTYIFEYYKSQTGFSEQEMTDYYSFVKRGLYCYKNFGNDTLLKRARQETRTIYNRKNPMRDYLYLRISKKEPFDILYFTPSVTGIFNLNDNSLSIAPEMLYVPITNLEVRLKGACLIGTSYSEFGERQNSYRIELRLRYYF